MKINIFITDRDRLAKQYYDRNCDSDLSQMSPQVADIFNDRMSKHTSFNLTFENAQAEYAVDFKKHYAQFLRSCDGLNMFGRNRVKCTT